MSDFKFWFWRVRVTLYGIWVFRRIGWYGFADDDMDRDAYEDGVDVIEYFCEAWCRE